MASTNNQQLFLAKPADLFCSIFLLVVYMFLLDLLVTQPEIANVFAAYPRVAMPMVNVWQMDTQFERIWKTVLKFFFLPGTTTGLL